MSQLVVPSAPQTLSFDPQRLHALVGDILEEARHRGAVAAEAGASSESGLSATVRLGEVETIEYNRDKGLGVTVYFPAPAGESGLRKGSASTTDFGAEAVRETVRAACDIARYTSADPYAGLAEAELMAREVPDLDLFHPWGVGAEEAVALALECEQAALDADTRIRNSEGASVTSHEGYRVYGNSHGFVGGYPTTRHSLSCAVIGEQSGAMQRDYWYSVSRVPGDLEAASAVGKRAAERTLRRLGSRRLGTEQVPVVFAAELAGGLLGGLLRAIGGGAQY
ncbi:MAG TPA: DNA gyrase modulator, partial [Gammaproteobacteria bacterium]|nr:DNA gyrase modulator [Gammaproteobacteria bacterium]